MSNSHLLVLFPECCCDETLERAIHEAKRPSLAFEHNAKMGCGRLLRLLDCQKMIDYFYD